MEESAPVHFHCSASICCKRIWCWNRLRFGNQIFNRGLLYQNSKQPKWPRHYEELHLDRTIYQKGKWRIPASSMWSRLFFNWTRFWFHEANCHWRYHQCWTRKIHCFFLRTRLFLAQSRIWYSKWKSNYWEFSLFLLWARLVLGQFYPVLYCSSRCGTFDQTSTIQGSQKKFL